MIRITELKLAIDAVPVATCRAADAPAETAADRGLPPHPIEALRVAAAAILELPLTAIDQLQVYKRSFDSRKARLQVVYIVDVTLQPPELEAQVLMRLAGHRHISRSPDMLWQPPPRFARGPERRDSPMRPIVVGFGPCGIFAALVLAQMGLQPLVIERGKPVRQRTLDTWGLWRRQQLQAESNVQFGEGGAGTFSDGKLYSQIKDPRHLGRKVLQEFVRFGASADILYAAHPHVGTFKLVRVVEGMRAEIIRLGGEIWFQSLVTDLQRDEVGKICALKVDSLESGDSRWLSAQQVILALGHSARDTFTMLHRHGIQMQAKAFSIGFRIEHPQHLIDQARWGRHAGHPMLGAADYKLVHHADNGRSVYTFCMCPGGTVVAATSEPHRVVTNGMSQYSRAERNANAGLVVAVTPADYPQQPALLEHLVGEGKHTVRLSLDDAPEGVHPLSGIVLQRQIESAAYVAGGGGYLAPGQRLGDFLSQQKSTQWGQVEPSYKPGVRPCNLNALLPDFAIQAMHQAVPVFGRQIKGYDLPDAVLTGVETRTSSPLRILRHAHTLQSPNCHGLYPAGEGAGYAGGILSAAIDGIRVAEALASAPG